MAYDLSDNSTISENINSSIRWKLFNSSSSELESHSKIIYSIASFKDTLITLSLDRTVLKF